MEKVQKALLFAEAAHFGQKYGNYPYMYHLLDCKSLGEKYGLSEDLIIALILHDCLEGSSVSYNDIKDAFGLKVAEIVYAVTDELGRNRKERKEKTYPKIKSNVDAIIVKLIDRCCNIGSSIEHNNSKMFECYKKEHLDFVNGIGASAISHGYDVIENLIYNMEIFFENKQNNK